MSEKLVNHESNDGIDRRSVLKCMAWVGTGLIWTARGGTLTSRVLGADPSASQPADDRPDFTFVQVSDSHIGFAKEPNKDVTATFQQAIARINAAKTAPAFLLHTGDLTHLSKPAEFDTVDQIVRTAKAGRAFYVPGEHDFFADDGRLFLQRHGKGTHGTGWHSFDYRGMHFVGLVNVANLKPGGMGTLGRDQLDWLKKDLAALTDSTPVVVFAHVPLWTVYAKWGWGTDDAAEALALLRRFGSVTVLNGHIHQVMCKVEGNVTFHTALSTAFPQPAPGTADSPGPMKNVAAEKLRSLLGLSTVDYVSKRSLLAVVDSTL